MPPMDRGRHYGLDWLRIGAFALLIVYHVAMVFAPWDWVVKWPQTFPALIAPMALLTPWRLPLLFVVSGFATRRLLARSPALGDFARARSARLLVPLAFALAVLLPPEMWVRVREHGDGETLAAYWLDHYWSLTPIYGFAFPTWEHLWFVVYLWAYTMVLTVLVALVGSDAVQRRIDLLASGSRIVWVPVAMLVLAKLALLFVVPERQGLTTDWAGHAEYFPLLLFGFALGGSPALWAAVARHWRGGAMLAALAAIVVVGVELAYRYHDVPPHAVMAADRAARIAMAWGVILVLLRAADTVWNRDHPLRAPLAEAVFPAYLVHHPVLVVLAWEAPALGLGAAQGFALLLSVTAGACALTYLVGRQIGWLRPLIGLAPAARRRWRAA